MEAIAGMLQDVGIKANLEAPDPAASRPLQRAFKLENWMGLTATASFDVQSTRVHYSAVPPRGGGFEPLELDPVVRVLVQTMDTGKQDELLRQWGDIAFSIHPGLFLFWTPPQIVISPEFVESWVWPGNVSGLWSHFWNIQVAKK